MLGTLVVIVGGFIVVKVAFPKELIRFPIYVTALLSDLYLWESVRKKVFSWKPPYLYSFSLLYWLPMLLVMLMGVSSLFVNLYVVWPFLANAFGGVIIIVYSAKLLTVVFFLLADLLKIIRYAVHFNIQKNSKKARKGSMQTMNRGKFLRSLGLIGGGFVLSGMIIGAVRWAYDFRLRREYLRFPVLPHQLQDFRIIQISDLHLGSWNNAAALEEAMDAINDEDPDLVVFTGDLVNFLTREAYPYKETLRKLKARYGVYAVLGNHDYGDYVKWDDPSEKEDNLIELLDLYDEIGWKVLRNEHEIIDVGGSSLAIAGVDNWSVYDRFPRLGDTHKALSGTDNADFRLMLTHDPSHWDSIISHEHPDVGLTLSGHTHGFQFGVELKNFRWSPAQYLYKRWAGLYENPATDTPQYLYVNRGLGMIGYPGRIGILPEITVLEIYS